MCGHITKLTAKLKTLKPEDEFRIKMTDEVGATMVWVLSCGQVSKGATTTGSSY